MFDCGLNMKWLVAHLFRLCSGILPYTDSYKYLGHVINLELKDDPDITKQTRFL